MRASLPSPSTSWACSMHSRAGEPSARRIERPPRVALADRLRARSVVPRLRTALRGQRLPPAAQRVVVVRARVEDLVAVVVLGPVRAVRVVGVEGELQDHHPREPQVVAQARDRRGDDAQVLGDQRQRPELGPLPRRTPRAPGRAPNGRARHRERRRARPRRRRSRGSGRCARRRTARTCAAAAAPTSGSACAGAPASRRCGLPHSWPLSVKRSGGAPATAPVRNSSGWARWSALPGAT